MIEPGQLQPRSNFPVLAPVLRAWSLSLERHTFNPGASEQRILETEKALGKPLPLSVRAVYEASDGVTLFGSSFSIYPLIGDKLCVADMSKWLRSKGWGIPEELILFGSNNSESTYGVWVPNPTVVKDAPVVVLGGANGDYKNMAVAATSITRFLQWVTSYCLLDGKDRTAALDAMNVPPNLRKTPGTYETYVDIARWADPDLRDCPPDPYANPVSYKWLQKRFGKAAN